jgi:hypothetical protein
MNDEPLYLALGKPDRFGVLWLAPGPVLGNLLSVVRTLCNFTD